MHKLNRVVFADEFLSDIFSTLSIVLIDDQDCTINYSGAGDLPLLKFVPNNHTLLSFKSDGILLGFSEKEHYNDIQLKLDIDEEIFLISDGMIDFEINGVKKTNLNLFKDKLHELKVNSEPTENIVNKLFNKHTSQIDDCSIIIIKRKTHEIN